MHPKNSIATTQREYELVQDVYHSKQKTVEFFINGCKYTLTYFNTLLEYLIVNRTCYMQQQLSTNHEPLVAWFLRELAQVVNQHKFRAYNEKHQVAGP